MNLRRNSLFAAGVLAVCSPLFVSHNIFGSTTQPKNEPTTIAVDKGIQWLVSVQGKDGGWGQDGGETSYVRVGERLESNGNDVANTAVAVQALIHAGNTPLKGEFRNSVARGIQFILGNVEDSPEQGLAVTRVTGTQIQRKLGPYIDTFLTSMLLADLDGNMGDAASNARVRSAVQKCVAKIENNQLKDGSWNISGGWAPILGTSMASRSLFVAQSKGVKVAPVAMAKVEEYTKNNATSGARGGVAGGRAGGVLGGVVGGLPAAAGVPLYQSAQSLEQLSRTPEDRHKNASAIKAITADLASPRFVSGFGSIGGEEFFSYLNVSDSLHRTGGQEWDQWNQKIKTQIVHMQNDDGTWAGHHCITGRVAVTGAAILTLLVDRDPVMIPATNRINKKITKK